ncbi:hypothetical protein HDU86_001674 [Geranomyces michiganensis]|nr:hypothetical protein HDU86_001674 [Geranomyces michiganensis]
MNGTGLVTTVETVPVLTDMTPPVLVGAIQVGFSKKNSDLLAEWADALADWKGGLAGFSYAVGTGDDPAPFGSGQSDCGVTIPNHSAGSAGIRVTVTARNKASLARTDISEPIDQSLPALPKFSLQLLDRKTGAAVHGQSPTAYLDLPIINLRVAGAESFSYDHLIEVGIIKSSLDLKWIKVMVRKFTTINATNGGSISSQVLLRASNLRDAAKTNMTAISRSFRCFAKKPVNAMGNLDPHVAKGNVNVSKSASVDVDATVPLNCSLGIFSSIALSTYDVYGPSPLSPLPTAANTVVQISISLGAASTAGVNLTAVVTATNPAGLKMVVQRFLIG